MLKLSLPFCHLQAALQSGYTLVPGPRISISFTVLFFGSLVYIHIYIYILYIALKLVVL